MSSRLHDVEGPRRPWTAPNGAVVDLPVMLDIILVGPDSPEPVWQVNATVDLIADSPCLTSMTFNAPAGIDIRLLQRRFRWATPLDVVTRTVPQLIERGLDPFEHEYATEGFPAAADLRKPPKSRLPDAFLEEIAREYLRIGRGYATAIATERGVSPRTVVSWIEKARDRGVLTPARPGAFGGEITPADRRRPQMAGRP